MQCRGERRLHLVGWRPEGWGMSKRSPQYLVGQQDHNPKMLCPTWGQLPHSFHSGGIVASVHVPGMGRTGARRQPTFPTSADGVLHSPHQGPI